MSYGTKYKVPFKSISDTDYEILIDVQDYTGAITELTGGANPITIETDSDDVLAPVRASKATVSVYGSDYLQDLYASNPQGIKVRLMKGTDLEWLGFMTPDTFSQDFSRPDFIYDMECVSALNTLKYKKFTENGSKITFLQLIKNAANLAGYTELYLTTAITDASSGNVYANSSVAVANFYDELDEAMNYYEILEEVAKYLVCSTFVPYKNALYLLDYKAIRNGLNQYYMYNPTNNNEPITVTLSHIISTQNLGYTGTGATLSRIAGKNKATVNCSLYELENLVPEFDDEKSTFSRVENYTETYTEGKETITKKGFIRYYNHPKFTFYKYQFGEGVTIVTEHTDPIQLTEVGSCFVRTTDYDVSNMPQKLNFENEVLVRAWDSVADAGTKVIPFATGKIITMKSGKEIIINTETRMCISFGMRFLCTVPTMPNGTGIDPFQPRIMYKDQANSADGAIPASCQLKLGNYIYNGATWESITPYNQGTYFLVDLAIGANQPYYGTVFSVKNTNDFTTGLGDMSGYLVNPPMGIISGELEFTINQNDIGRSFLSDIFNTRYFYIKDIKLEIGIPDTQNLYGDWVNKNSKNDLVYENGINDDYIEEADEIDLKICTAPTGKLCLSSVMTATGYQGNINSLSLNDTDIAEQLILKKIVSTYSAPRFVINPTVKNGLKPYSLVTDGGLAGVSFVYCGGEEDIFMESVTTNLIQL